MHSPFSILANPKNIWGYAFQDKCIAPSQYWLTKLEVQDLHALVQYVCHTHIIRELENHVLSDARQPEVDVFHSCTVLWPNMVASTHIKR